MFNSRNPDPRRAWKGGSEPQLLTPDLRIRRIRRIPGMSSKPMILFGAVLKTNARVMLRAPALCLFYFLMTAPSRMPTFQTISERWPVAAEIAKSKAAEILISGIPKASGLRGSIPLVKLVSHLLARAHNLSCGANIYKTCTTKTNIYYKLPIHHPSGYYVIATASTGKP